MYAEPIRMCSTCKEQKDISCFYFNKTKQRYFSECKNCNKKRSSLWNKANAESYKKNSKLHKIKNPEKYIMYKKNEYVRNKNKYRDSGKRYRNSKHGRAVRLHLGRLREAKIKKATPTWLTKSQIEDIKKFYLNRPSGYHVDHIVPLSGKIVCGLHVSWNLQYLPAIDNIKKRNKF